MNALMWSRDGTYLYCGYASGKLLQFYFDFEDGVMEATPMLECGSPIMQFSLNRRLLLISTLARSLLLETDSGRLTQVSRLSSLSLASCAMYCPFAVRREVPVYYAALFSSRLVRRSGSPEPLGGVSVPWEAWPTSPGLD